MPNQKNNKGKKSKRTNSSGDEQENGVCAAATGGAAAAAASAAAPRAERPSGKRGNRHRRRSLVMLPSCRGGGGKSSVRLWHASTATPHEGGEGCCLLPSAERSAPPKFFCKMVCWSRVVSAYKLVHHDPRPRMDSLGFWLLVVAQQVDSWYFNRLHWHLGKMWLVLAQGD